MSPPSPRERIAALVGDLRFQASHGPCRPVDFLRIADKFDEALAALSTPEPPPEQRISGNATPEEIRACGIDCDCSSTLDCELDKPRRAPLLQRVTPAEDGSLDELVAHGTVILEQMDEGRWSLHVSRPGESLLVTLWSEAPVYARIEEHAGQPPVGESDADDCRICAGLGHYMDSRGRHPCPCTRAGE